MVRLKGNIFTRRLLATLIAIMLIAWFLIYEARGFLYPYRYDPGASSSRKDITHLTGTAPPTEARDIRVASYMSGQAWSDFVRFSAPTDVCLKYAEQLSHKKLQPITEDQVLGDFGPLKVNALLFPDLSWFDLPYTQKYWFKSGNKIMFRGLPQDEVVKIPSYVMAADYSSVPEENNDVSVRVDTQRGVFYYYDWH